MRKLILAGLLTVFGCSAAHAEYKEIRISLWVPPSHALVKAFEDWGKSVSEASGGTLKTTLFPAEQLGKAVDQYDMARDGVAEMTMVAPAYNSGQFPIILLKEVPFMFKNSTKGVRALHEWYLDYAGLEMPDVKLCVMGMHHPATLHMKDKPVHVPSDMNGTKLRTAGSTMVAFVTGQGASTVQAPLPEIRALVERGVVDGVTFPWDLSVASIQDTLTYHLDLPIYIGAQLFVMNKGFYDSLDKVQKAAVDSHCTPEWSEKLSTPWAEAELAARQKTLSDPRHTVYKPTAAEVAQWVEAARPIREKAVQSVARYNLDGNKLLDDLKAKLAKYDAAF